MDATEHQVASSLLTTWSAEFSLPDIVQVEGKDLAMIKSKSEYSHRFLSMKQGNIGQEDMDASLSDLEDVSMDEEDDDEEMQ